MIVVTGGAGFIGSNLVHALNRRGRTDIVVVDDLEHGAKFDNIADADVHDFLDKTDFLEHLRGTQLSDRIEAVLHMGACSDTTVTDGRYVMRTNYEYSKVLLAACRERGIPFIYASSAAVYGIGVTFAEQRCNERPINVYAYSKFLFDQYVRRSLPETRSQVVGLRYFNVYGPRESHKHSMASVAFHMRRSLQSEGKLKLFRGTGGYADGEQRRDFIHVDDAVAVTLWFLDHPAASGVFNAGTGHSHSFNEVARAAIEHYGYGDVSYVPFPEHLRGRYQSFTEADLTALRSAGYPGAFMTVREGVYRYLRWLDSETGIEAPQVDDSRGYPRAVR